MAMIENYNMPNELYYTRDHAWIKVEGDKIRIGITDFMQKLAGDITFIRVPRADKQMAEGKTLASLQSGKWAGKILVPMSGMVVEANKSLVGNPGVMNEDPYGEGWIAVMKPDHVQDGLKSLLQGSELEAWLREEIAAHS